MCETVTMLGFFFLLLDLETDNVGIIRNEFPFILILWL